MVHSTCVLFCLLTAYSPEYWEPTGARNCLWSPVTSFLYGVLLAFVASCVCDVSDSANTFIYKTFFWFHLPKANIPAPFLAYCLADNCLQSMSIFSVRRCLCWRLDETQGVCSSDYLCQTGDISKLRSIQQEPHRSSSPRVPMCSLMFHHREFSAREHYGKVEEKLWCQ